MPEKPAVDGQDRCAWLKKLAGKTVSKRALA
jgi:hypothetical protein